MTQTQRNIEIEQIRRGRDKGDSFDVKQMPYKKPVLHILNEHVEGKDLFPIEVEGGGAS